MTERDGEQGAAFQRKAQRRAWLSVDHRGRLAWLEEAKRFAARALEAAARRNPRPPGKGS